MWSLPHLFSLFFINMSFSTSAFILNLFEYFSITLKYRYENIANNGENNVYGTF